MNIIEIEHSTPFEQIKIYVNTELVKEDFNCQVIKFNIDVPVDIVIDFKPYKIKPIIRFNNFMLDYWLANIRLQDHQLKFAVNSTFYQDYKNKNIDGRISSLPPEQQNVEHFWDKYIGINNLHPELVAEIKNLLKK